MKSRFALSGAILSMLGLLAWLFLSNPGGSDRGVPPAASSPSPVEQEKAGGSAVPCATPLPWRIATIDDRFALSPAQARAAVQQAAELWERAVGRRLFSDDPAAGFPIRFEYDDRQANLQERIGLQREIEEAGRRLAAERAELSDRRAGFEEVQAAYEERLDEFDRQATDHNVIVRGWNERGDAPEAVLEELRSVGEKLEVEHRELDQQRQELATLRRSLQDEVEGLNGELGEHARRRSALGVMFPLTRVEAGLYWEVVKKQTGRVVSIQRGIDIYRFADLDDLEFVIAHELGHALGLGHATVPGALMGEEHGGMVVFAGGSIQPSDLALLRSRCPQL